LDFTAKKYEPSLENSQNYMNYNDSHFANTNKQNPEKKDRFKRCVSESKKKYVASKQGWKCRECQTILPATFEIDHIQRLQHGGSNEIDNLQALCPNCHRSKTMLETML
jgi:5-methylcytosine-specific restriction endonuclease McrA